MPKYKYVVRNIRGKASTGLLEAESQDELRHMLRANELYLTKVKLSGKDAAAAAAANGQQSTLFASRVKARDIVILIRQMATLVRAGVPFVDGLITLEQQAEKPQLKLVLKDLFAGVNEGKTLSSMMALHPKVFNTLTVSLVQAGEATGMLDKALEVAAEQLDREDDLRSRVKAAMVYPKLVVLAAVGTVALMLLLVVPTFKMVYAQFHGTLPTPTLALMAISDFCVHFWWLIAIVGGGSWYGFVQWRKTATGGRTIDTWVLKIPVVGPLLRKVAIARVAQTLGNALKGGVPVLHSLALAGQTAGNVIIRDAVLVTVPRVRDGEPMGEELEKTGQFPPMVTSMIKAGENTGQLDHMLDEINRYYEQDIEYAIEKMTKLIEPIVTIMVGAIVLFVLLALYMPIFNLGKTVTGSK